MENQDYKRFNKALSTNQKLWENWTPINVNSKFYGVKTFKEGRSTLPKIDVDALGNVTNKTLLHLQCHFGMDTLSWARLGAHVTGLDFSAAAIAQARQLANELQLDANFVHCNLYEALEHIGEQFDVVVTTAGVLCWLPDIVGWAKIAASFVRPGGHFYLRDVHPSFEIYDDNPKTPGLHVIYDYFGNNEPIHFTEEGNYADPKAPIASEAYNWIHSLSSVANSLISHGLVIDKITEFPFLEWKQLNFMQPRDETFWELPQGMPKVPLMYNLCAHKPN